MFQNQSKYSNPILGFLEKNSVRSALIGFGLIFLGILLYRLDANRAANWSIFIGLVLLGAAGYTLHLWLKERAIIALFKKQTRDVFIYSLGQSETHEDDNTIAMRVEEAIEYLRIAKNKHRLSVYYAFFRDAFVFAVDLDEDGNVLRRRRIDREGLTVRETREEFNTWYELFRAEREQEKLRKSRGDASDGWVDVNWFNQARYN